MDRQPHRIIVEGMDGSGKTTLIQFLTREFPTLQVVTRPQGRAFDDWWPEELDRQKSEPVPIHDRFFFSELVYGPVLRHQIAANMDLVQNCAWFLRSTSLLIYARPHSQILQESILNKPQMEGVVAHFQQLLEAYDQIMTVEMQWFGDRFYHYDFAQPNSVATAITMVRNYLNGA